ncbi:MAG: hypothetical protein Q7J86_10695 [Bacteroidota bacterium]|nr:hypothetical protein [Bacteroidota bacterium]MDO9614974.1 hypothetical protein [Bacteroidota bacterium]
MKTSIFVLVIALLFAFETKAQDYNTGIGLRGGFASGLTVKHFLGQNKAIEGIFDTRWQGFSITGLYEIHAQAFNTNRLNWYYGFGGHIGFWNGKHYRDVHNELNYTVVGIDGILGLEYNFEEIPINLSIDWKPAFDLFGYSGFYGDGGAISIRYIF